MADETFAGECELLAADCERASEQCRRLGQGAMKGLIDRLGHAVKTAGSLAAELTRQSQEIDDLELVVNKLEERQHGSEVLQGQLAAALAALEAEKKGKQKAEKALADAASQLEGLQKLNSFLESEVQRLKDLLTKRLQPSDN